MLGFRTALSLEMIEVSPQAFDSWNSLEGVAHPPLAATPKDWRGRCRAGLSWAGDQLPGVALASVLAYAAESGAEWIGHSVLGYRQSPINGVPLAIILGVTLCNTIGIPKGFEAGLKTCMRPIQRLAIMLLGWRLSLGAVGGIGVRALPAVIISIAVALAVVPWAGIKVGLTRKLATLIAVGTSICGVSAIMATAPTIDAEESEVSYAVACVAIFGMLAMLSYPFLMPLLWGASQIKIGIFLGTAIHDTAQVTGAALSYSQMHDAPLVLNTATIVKIMRNLSMAAVIPFMAASFHRRSRGKSGASRAKVQILPFFVVGFLGMTVLRTIGDATPRAFGILSPSIWSQFLSLMDHTSTALLTVVMAAIGLCTGLASLRKLGIKPFFVGLFAALLVGAVSATMIHLLPWLRS